MPPSGLDEVSSVATHVQKCLKGFHNACDSFTKADASIRSKVPRGTIHDALGRFRLWVGNIGAHRRGRASLDYKLREASHIRDRVIELLQNLETVLQEALEIISGDRVSWEDLSDSDSDSDSTENEIQRSEEELSTELGQLTSNMAEINSCLMRLSLAIRNPAPHDQFKESSQIEVAHFEPFDVDHVRDKFPKAAEYLILRLGKAISRRRQYLRYREDHRKKLEQGLAPQPVSQEPTAPRQITNTLIAPSEKIESTVASSIPLAFKHSTAASTLNELDDYEDTLSQTSYASSNQDLTRLRPPPLPEEGQDGEPFECPLCFRFTSVRQVPVWHKHVYRDLQPYICTFEDCEIPDRTYESRHEWFQHELQAHRRWWQCIDECNATFHSLHKFHEHLQYEHAELADNERVTDMVRSCERQDSMDIEAECQLCQAKLSSLILLRRHLGKHHEELSLFALPSHMKEDDDEEENGDVELGSASSVAGSDRSLRISSLDKSNPRIRQARELLRAKPAVIQAMDSQILDTTLLDPQLRQSMPGDVNTWAELEQWLNTSRRTNIFAADLEHIRVLQAVQFQTMVLTQEIDEYFERLTSFHKDRGSGDISDLVFFVGEKLHSIYELVRAIITHGGFYELKELRYWEEIGKDLGNGKELTPSGLHKLDTAYEHYLLPFENFRELGEEGSPEGVSRVNLTIQSGSLDSDLGADVVLRAVPVSTTADGLRGRILLTKPSIAAPGRVRLTYAGREMKNLETLREILPSELHSENYVFHIDYESVDQEYGVTSGGTTSNEPPAPPVDLADGGYSYTDPASMYRDTEPAWRRPRAGSLERGSRPTSMIMDHAPRSSAREPGPPPSVRGFDKINSSIVPTSHMVSLPGLVMLMTTDASGTVPSLGKLELSENFWLYVSRDSSLHFNISFDSVVGFGIFRPKQLRLEGNLCKEFYTDTEPVVKGDMFFSFTDTGDFVAAYGHIQRKIPDKLRKFEMSADDSQAVQDLIADYDTLNPSLIIHEVHDIEIEASAEMGTMLASMVCTPTDFVLIDQGSEEQWGFSCEDLISYSTGYITVEVIARAVKRLSNHGRASKHFFVGASQKIRMRPRNLANIKRVADLMEDYIDKGRATRLRERTTGDNDSEPLNVEPNTSHDLSIDQEGTYLVEVCTVHTDNQEVALGDLAAATLSLHDEIVSIEYIPIKIFADGSRLVNLSSDGQYNMTNNSQYYITESAIWLFGAGYPGLVNICITPQVRNQLTEIVALVEKALGTERRLEEFADVLKKDLRPTQTRADDKPLKSKYTAQSSSTATVQGIETIPMFPGLDITSTKANIDGVPSFDREKLALVQISSAELSFRDDGAPAKEFCIRSEGLENVSMQGRSVHVTGWLQCLGNSTKPKVPGVLPGCKNFTMTFDSEVIAKSIFTMLRLVLKRNLRGYGDQELNPQEQRSQKPGVAVGDEIQTSSQLSYEHEPSKQQGNLPSGDREFTHTSGPDVPSTGNDGVSSEETIPELEKSQEKSEAHDFASRPREAESTSTPLPQIINKESHEEMEDNARVQGMSSKMSDVPQEEKEAPKFELSDLVDFAERNFIKPSDSPLSGETEYSISCPYECGTVLTGLRAVGNFIRHLKSKDCPNLPEPPEYPCPVLGCSNKYAQVHNLKVHILKRHGAPAERRRPLGVIDHVQSHERIDLSSGSVPSSAVITASEIDVSSSDYDEMSMTGEDSDREEGDIDELNPHQQSTTIWPDPRAQTVEENDIFTVVGIPNLDPTTRVRASYELIYWSLHDPADPEQRFWLFDYDTVKASTSSSSSELFISIKASIIEYPIGRQLSETEIKLTALNHSSGLTLLSVLEHRNKSQMKAGPNLSRATTIDFADSSANPSGSNSAGLPPKMIDRPMNEPSVWPDHSSYWSVSELQDFDKNIAHFGTDWHAIASNMPTKTHPMVKTQYLRLVEQGRADLEQAAREADSRRERGDYLGPPPIPTPAPERRYEGIQTGTLGASYRHGDLMPENILVFEEGGPIGKLKIEDWGEAKYQGKNTAIRAGKTTTRFGNKRYEAPEVETAVDTAEHASATSNATEEKPESAQSTAQTQLAPEHAADMSTESRDTKADRLEQPIFSCTVKAHIGVGSPDSLDLSLLTEARLTLFPTYYELKQNSETHVWYYSDAWRMNIRGRTISIGRYFDTLFLRAASRRDVDAITEILSEEIPSVKNFDNGKSDSYVAGQHVDNASSSEDDMESEMNIGAERTSRTTKAVLAQLNKTSEANRRTSVDSDVFSPSDAPELQGEQQEEDMQEPHESRFLRRTDSERLQELLDEYEQGEGREEVAKIRRPKGQSFTRTMDLERHFLNKHAQEKPEYWCPILGCDRSDSKGNPFPRKDKMEDHIRTRHPDYEGLDEYHFGAVAARKTTDASAERSQSGPKGILRPPTKTFPEDPEPIREGVAPHKDSVRGKDVPVNARWTKIDRRLVNPEALEEAKERFEERMDCIIVLRVLTKEEIQKLADRTKEIRERRDVASPNEVDMNAAKDKFALAHDGNEEDPVELSDFDEDEDPWEIDERILSTIYRGSQESKQPEKRDRISGKSVRR